jgi:hypothetical protein
MSGYDNGEYYECSEKNVLVDSIAYLIYLKNPWKLSSSNPAETINCLAKINDINFRYNNTFDFLSHEKKLDFIEIMFDYLKYMHERLNENLQRDGLIIPLRLPLPVNNSVPVKPKFLILENSSKVANVACLNLPNELEILYKMTLCIWSWADKSSDFCLKVHDTKAIKVFFKFFANTSVVECLLEHVRTNNNYFKLALTYRALVGAVHNLSRYHAVYPYEWHNLNSFCCLQTLAELFGSRFPNLDVQLLAYFALINLFNRDMNKLEQMADLKEVNLHVFLLFLFILNLIIICCALKSLIRESCLR